jgi:hypothetical protein
LSRHYVKGESPVRPSTLFDVEPLPPDHPFRRLENVIATPHIGYVSRELYRTFYRDTVENIAKWLVNAPSESSHVPNSQPMLKYWRDSVGEFSHCQLLTRGRVIAVSSTPTNI